MIRTHLFVVLLCTYAVVGCNASVRANDRLAIDAIFADQHVRESGRGVCETAGGLPPDQRMAFLQNWILPGPTHRHFRVSVDFVAADRSDGGELLSPALDCIETAVGLHQAESLFDVIERIEPDSPADQTVRLALMTMLAAEVGNVDDAESLAKSFFAHVFASDDSIRQSLDAAVVLLWHARSSPPIARLVAEPGQQLIVHFKSLAHRDPIHQHLKSIVMQLIESVHAAEFGVAASRNSDAQWHIVSRSRAVEHGLGYPATQWRFSGTGVRNLSSHGDDFLFFAVPLVGDLDLEADVTGFNWSDSHFMTAGTWVAPIYGHRSMGLGNLRGQRRRGVIDPPLTSTSLDATIHYRTSIRGDAASTSFNGRLVHQEPVADDPDPWLALRSTSRYDGGADDIRITGGRVPRTINLSATIGLPMWYEYFQSQRGSELVRWRQAINDDAASEIIGLKDERLVPGCDSESLLVYGRPMLEDGTIDYEFWYEPGRYEVHPAIARRAFLLQNHGVRGHSITDGRYEREDVRSATANDVYRTADFKMEPDAWNKVSLKLVGDTLAIWLNGKRVYEETLPPEALKRFGLFHYDDRTTARVRNLSWTGNWMNSPPVLNEQTLAGLDEILTTNRLAPDDPRVTHSLDDDSFSSGRFVMSSGHPTEHFRSTDAGIVISRPAEGAYCEARVTPNLVIEGDFDVTAEFDDLTGHSIDSALACAVLEMHTEGDVVYQASLRLKFESDGTRRLQCVATEVVDGQRRPHYFGHVPTDASAGRLRISRRGTEAIFQFAENDSRQFRVIARHEFTDLPLGRNGVRFGHLMMGETGFMQSRWKSIDVQAESLSGVAASGQVVTMEQLNRSEQLLAQKISFDFKAQSPPAGPIYRWGDSPEWNRDDQGLQFRHPGRDSWESAGLWLRHPMAGDFDVAIEFDSVKMAVPKAGKESTVVLQIQLADPKKTRVSSVLRLRDDRSWITHGQRAASDDQGAVQYENFALGDARGVKRLRVARRGTIAYCLAGSGDPAKDRIVGQIEIGDAAVLPSGTRVMLHTGGEGRTSTMRLTSLSVQADAIGNGIANPATPMLPGVRPPAAAPKSLLQSIFDLF